MCVCVFGVIRRRQSCTEPLDVSKTCYTLEEDHFDWHAETTFIHHATLSYTATSDFKPSHPPTSSPKRPLSSAINHHLATGHWAQSKVTLHPATNTTGGGQWRERQREKGGKQQNREERAIGWEHGGKRERERERHEHIYLPGCHSGREIFDVNSISIWLVETQLRLEWNQGWFTAPQKEVILARNSDT